VTAMPCPRRVPHPPHDWTLWLSYPNYDIGTYRCEGVPK
jgi:hypothetical protein